MSALALTPSATTRRLTDWSGLGQVLQAPPPRAIGYTDMLEYATRLPRHALPPDIELPPGIEGDPGSGWFRSVSSGPQGLQAAEFLRMAPGAWLVFGEYRHDMPHYFWTREQHLRAFGIVLRGGGVYGFAHSPQQRFALTEGQALGIAYGADTLICRAPLPGVTNQVALVYFENDRAMQEFGLDVDEALGWLSSVPGGTAAPGLRLVASRPNALAMKAAQAICWTTFQGARRRLFLRCKAGEMLCQLMASPGAPVEDMTLEGDRACDDASLAALAHEALSDPEHCPELGAIAARFRVSTGRLLAAFRATYGISLRDHMGAIRMARARSLLQRTQMPLAEVALACGYEHHSSFSTAYRRSFGETPAETRRAGTR